MVSIAVFHVVKDSREETTHADQRRLVLSDCVNKGLVLDVNAEVNDLETVGGHHGSDNVLAEVVDVVLDRTENQSSVGLLDLPGQPCLKRSTRLLKMSAE